MNEPNPRMSLEHMVINHYPLEAIERHVRRWAIKKTLSLTKGNQCKAAELLGVHRNTINRAIVELGIERKRHGCQANLPGV